MLLSVLASAWVFFTNVPCAQAGTHGMDAVQQNRTVKGRVFDSTGEPIIGATVKVAGRQTATVTDLAGGCGLWHHAQERLDGLHRTDTPRQVGQ